MPSSLFNLISRAGSMTLGELQVRSPTDNTTLSQELAQLVQTKRVDVSKSDLSYTPGGSAEAVGAVTATAVLHAAAPTTGNSGTEDLAKAIEAALGDWSTAESIKVTPTTQGFRSSIS